MISGLLTHAAPAVFALASLAGAAAAGDVRAPATVALAAAPARLQLVAGAIGTIQVTNPGAASVIVEAAPAGYAVDRHGRPRIGAARRSTGGWLAVAPHRLALPRGGSAMLRLSTVVPRKARPGDHTALLLLTTQPVRRGSVPARVRIGVVVVVRVPGRIVRRLMLRGIDVRRRGRARVLEVSVADRGNVDEWVGARRLSITLVRNGRVLARLRPAGRRFLAHTIGVVVAPCRGVRGPVDAVVRLARPWAGVPILLRTYRIRL